MERPGDNRTVRFPEGTFARIEGLLAVRESGNDLIREAVEREIVRRERRARRLKEAAPPRRSPPANRPRSIRSGTPTGRWSLHASHAKPSGLWPAGSDRAGAVSSARRSPQKIAAISCTFLAVASEVSRSVSTPRPRTVRRSPSGRTPCSVSDSFRFFTGPGLPLLRRRGALRSAAARPAAASAPCGRSPAGLRSGTGRRRRPPTGSRR